jgi:hypothetical protein
MHAGTGILQAWRGHAERPEEKASRHTVRPGSLGLTLEKGAIMSQKAAFVVCLIREVVQVYQALR